MISKLIMGPNPTDRAHTNYRSPTNPRAHTNHAEGEYYADDEELKQMLVAEPYGVWSTEDEQLRHQQRQRKGQHHNTSAKKQLF